MIVLRNQIELFISLLLLLAMLPSCNGKKQNRLAKASSPYLQQHADNPVDWWEWGEEALQRARTEDKPLLVSVGYASCHWCHEMEKESFMDTAVARLMNENFVCIKIDREERPDIDKMYMNASQLLTGNAGWPLNAFALPDGKPFFAGSYYSKQSWTSLLKQITAAYRNQRQKVQLQAGALSNGIARLEFTVLTDSAGGLPDKQQYQQIFERLYAGMDTVLGGWKGAPKFPRPSGLQFLLQHSFLTGDQTALRAATTTLKAMALGGIYDQVGGGFARYAVDSLWKVPHFEKMLYDNAQLLSVYAQAYQLTGDPFFKTIVQETAGFLQKELKLPGGGFASSLSAVTGDGEGWFYTWQGAEAKKTLGGNYDLIAGYYNIGENGNWKEGQNILFATTSPEEYARQKNLSPAAFSGLLAEAKRTLSAQRQRREKPGRDEKVLTAWNALAITGFADAFAATGDESYLDEALNTARFAENKLMQKKLKGVWRNFKDGQNTVDGFLDDHALLAAAFLRLYQLTFDNHWLEMARQLTDNTLARFYDRKEGLFYYSLQSRDSTVIRKLELTDNDLPASNAVMAGVLHTLGTLYNDDVYKQTAERKLLRMQSPLLSGEGKYYASWGLLAGLTAYGTNEVVIIGKEAITMSRQLQRRYLPQAVFMGSEGPENLPLLQGKGVEGKTMIYVCTNRTCKRPVEDPAAALAQLLNEQKPAERWANFR